MGAGALAGDGSAMSERVATLIASPQGHALTPMLAERACEAVGSRHLYWLANGIACDIPLPEGTADAHSPLRDALGEAPIDVVVQPADGRRKRLLIADMDSTMIEQECIDELAAEVGRKEEVAAVTAAAMRGEIDFEDALRERVATLKGLPVSVIDKVIDERITLRSGGRELLATMRRSGAHTMLVSGGFTAFTSVIAARLGFHEHRANELLVEDGALTGTVAEPILGQQAKLEALNEAVNRLGLDASETLAVGDGANDLAMIEASGIGVALHAKPAVAARAAARIDHGDLTALLYIQGYRDSDVAR